MQIDISLADEQQKALLTAYTSIEEYIQRVVENRANRIIDDIVRDCADGKVSTVALAKTEQSLVDKATANKIVVRPDRLPKEVKALIVKKSIIPAMVEKIAAQEEKIIGPQKQAQ